MAEEPEIYAPTADGALRQGELICGLHEYRPVESGNQGSTAGDSIQVTRRVHPYAIVMSQDCDLEQDHLARVAQGGGVLAGGPDRLLPNVIFCEVVEASTLRLQDGLNSDLWRRVLRNSHQRYQYLSKVPPARDRSRTGLPDLGIDFKKYFTVPTSFVYEQLSTTVERRCRLVSPYLEHLSTRFSYYQFRIALPMNHK